MTAVHAVDRWNIIDHDAVPECWAEYTEQLHHLDPLAVSLAAIVISTLVPDPPINEETPGLRSGGSFPS